PGAPGTGAPGRRRRVSCTLVVTVACAVAAALLGTYFLGVLPGQEGKSGNDAGKSPGPHVTASGQSSTDPDPTSSDGGGSTEGATGGAEPTPTATGRSSEPPGSGEPGAGAVPEAFLGKWQGNITTQKGLPGGQLTVTIKQGAKGAFVASGGTSLAGTTCEGRWKLRTASAKRLTAESVGTSDSPLCDNTDSTDVFTLGDDGSLRFASRAGPSGKPTGTLRKIG
ncbi:hypothetical protein G5C65_02040, partial [Streptomyces sp. SB3404]|nr:hypothetical protein [Streptomyces boncukensis]